MKYFFLPIIFLLITVFAKAQYPFQLNGTTTNTGTDSYQLTPAVNNIFGAMWHKLRVNLDDPLNIQGQMNFGSNDGLGADGICFVMQNGCLVSGTPGGGIGYKNMPGQSIAVEFDTYQNIEGTGSELNNDPVYDHIAVEKNGDVTHDGSADDITAPIQMDALSGNVETNTFYDFIINYDPVTKRLRVFFNDLITPRVDIIYDIKTNVFGGNSWVYWGFTSSTGGSNNEQSVNINSALTTQGLRDTTICTGSVAVALDPLIHLQGTNIASGNTSFSSTGTSSAAFDGNINSRWESVHDVDPQWIYVDLVSPTDIDSVVLYWEAARAKDYLLQTSTDAITWTTVFSTTDAASCCRTPQTIPNAGTTKDKIIFSATNIRYVRMYGTARLIGYGYSLWEFQVFGQPKYVWSTNNGTEATISPNIYSSSVTLTPTVTTTYSVVIPDACLGFATYPATVTIDCSSLPVELTSFTARAINKGVGLQWSTASEQNTGYFEVLKSLDGIHFYTIGYVSASNNSSTTISYNFHDNESFSGTAYYKLITVDLDGSRQASGIRSVSKENNHAFITSPIFENETSLVLSGNPDWLEYSITDMLGRIIYSTYLQSPPVEITIGQNLAPAAYLILVKTDLYSTTFKVGKMR